MSEYVYATDEYRGHWLTGEEIVRCRDCKHYVEDPTPIDPGWPMMCEDSGRDMLNPDGFCAWGERRDA
jgi:hypothetical protein